MESIKRTSVGKSYWNNEGAYQEELDKLNEQMPAMGAAETLNGELVRAINRLYYDYCNNGNINACTVKTCEVETGWEDEDGNMEYEEEESREWNPYYEKFYDLILNTIECSLTGDERNEFIKAMSMLEDMVVGYEPGFSDDEMHVYDTVTDFVVWYVINHEDRTLPDSYDNR